MTAADRDALRRDLMTDEGFRAKPYRCSAGILTIGYGTNIEEISEEEARYLLDRRTTLAIVDLACFPWFHSLDSVRKRALINMRYQLGPSRFRGFKKMIAALARGDFNAAADEALDSKWAKLDTPERAARVAGRLRTGKEPR